MAVELHWTETGVEILVDGDFPNQMVAINRALTGDPRSQTVSRMLFDVLKADNFYADAGLLSAIAEMDFAAYKDTPRRYVAVVTTNKRMLEIVKVYSGEYERLKPGAAVWRCFHDLDGARAWLNEAS